SVGRIFDGPMSACENLLSSEPAAKQIAEKGPSACHSERSEESLCARCQEKERFLVAPLLGMTRLGSFSANSLAADILDSELSNIVFGSQSRVRKTVRPSEVDVQAQSRDDDG